MRIAFSKPAAGADAELLMNGFRAAGFEGLQLKTGQFLPWLQDPEGFQQRYTEEGVASALVYYDELDDERLASVVRFAAAVGSERVVFCHDRSREGIGYEERIAIARQLIPHAERAREQGVAFSLHHHFGHPVMLPQDVVEFWSVIEPGLIGLTVDIAHLALSDVDDIPGFIAEFAPIVDNIHFKDVADREWRLVGEGSLDLEAILRQLDASGYDGWLCIDEETTTPVQAGLSASRKWLDVHRP